MKIITFEGSDYSGKTTISKFLAEKLKNKYDVYYNEGVIFPTETSIKICNLANEVDNITKELLYTTAFMLDKQEYQKLNDINLRTILQDRYWQSTVAYGRFLNGRFSLHYEKILNEFFLKPTAIIYLTCSIEEKIRRSYIRQRKSVIDKFIFDEPERINTLENEIINSLQGSDNIIHFDTSNITIECLADSIEKELINRGVLKIYL